MCVNPVSLYPMYLMKEIGETVLIPICLNVSNITLRGIIGQTLERIIRLVFMIRNLTEINRSLVSMFKLPDVSLSTKVLRGT